ncbi:hypothetical protein VHEMI00839 [[Torrubiella] hemipterigena]|uniref:Peptidase S53 domain-containing protein n=1 Tax=[Torrubiella] hemipterigena TaxID=1531966 RepID=A0A0A1SKF0_9HYPO|nr:hypothetical protein VHEMI00839 [[Torrubiella] hemipterigena]
MHLIATPAAILCLLLGAHASPLAQPLGAPTTFANAQLPSQWKQGGTVASDTSIKMSIGLKQGDMAGLQAKLLDVSNPSSRNYGKWLSKDELNSYTKPSEQTLQLVKQWLFSHGLHDADISQTTPDWIELTIPVGKAEEMLNAQYSYFTDKSDKTAIGTLNYSLPSLLHQHIDVIQPTTAFHSTQNKAPKGAPSTFTSSADACANGVTAACITSAYNVDYVGSGKSSLAVTGMIGFSASHSDAKTYLSEYFPKGKGTDFKDKAIGPNVHPNDPSNPVLEGNLDTQIALSVGYPDPVTYLAVGPNDNNMQFGDELIALGQYLNSADQPPLSISSSYLGNEPEFDSDYKTRICNEFMKAGSRGISVFFCSGDYGVNGLDYENYCSNGFTPAFPASCPWVTAVGSTEFANGGEKSAEFYYIKNGTSGGGFSWFYDAPNYQTNDTQAYVKSLSGKFKGQYAPGGRGIPDVSLVGKNYKIILNNQHYTAEGTSASSPAWASLISQINDYRQSIGKSSLGFINPALYQNKAVRAALRDVTAGANKGCGGDAFPAKAGWDAATGLGSMDFAALRKALGAL